jgi:hypothetical protein
MLEVVQMQEHMHDATEEEEDDDETEESNCS